MGSTCLKPQADSHPFNRASLFNAGFLEASAGGDFDCFVFHDVDLLPEDDRVYYGCPSAPRQWQRDRTFIQTTKRNAQKWRGKMRKSGGGKCAKTARGCKKKPTACFPDALIRAS